jgi:hypothetical protein
MFNHINFGTSQIIVTEKDPVQPPKVLSYQKNNATVLFLPGQSIKKMKLLDQSLSVFSENVSEQKFTKILQSLLVVYLRCSFKCTSLKGNHSNYHTLNKDKELIRKLSDPNNKKGFPNKSVDHLHDLYVYYKLWSKRINEHRQSSLHFVCPVAIMPLPVHLLK